MEGPIVVIGGGIVGTSIAYHLQERGKETILIERDIDPQGASAFSFASLSAFDEPVRDVCLLKSLGMAAWRKWAARLGGDVGLRWDGEIRWTETPESASNLRSLMDRAASRGYPLRTITKADIARRLPASKPKEVVLACLAPQDGQADPLRVIDAAGDAFTRLGGERVVGKAGLIFDGSGVQVRVREDQVEPSAVVVATGAETAALLERLGFDISMDPSPGFLVVTEPTDPVVFGTVYVAARDGLPIHLRQLDDGRVVIGERAQDEVAKNPTLDHAQRLLNQASVSFPALANTSVDHFTVEWRPMPRDRKPIVGPLPGLPSVYVVAAHSGVTLAPVLGDLVARELVDKRRVARLEHFRPERFGANQAAAFVGIEEAFKAPADVFIG